MIFTKIFKFIWSIVSKGGLKIKGVFSLMNNKAVYFKTFKGKIVNLGSGLNSCLNTTKHGFIIIIKSVRKKVVSLSNWVNRIYPRLLLLALFIFFACIVALRLRERLPTAIFPVSNLQWYIYMELLLINLIVLLILIRSLSGSKPSVYFAKITRRIQAYASDLQAKIRYEYMSLLYSNYNIAYFLQYLLYLNYKFFSELDSRTQTGYYYVFLIIPQTIVCLMFSYDVLIGNYFLYFYKVVWLLLLPLAFRMFVYSLDVLTRTELPAIEQLHYIPKIISNNWDGWQGLKDRIIMDQTADEMTTVWEHVYNHVKNVRKWFLNYPDQDQYTAFRQYLIYKRIRSTLAEIEAFKASKKKTEIVIRVLYITSFAYILTINKLILITHETQ